MATDDKVRLDLIVDADGDGNEWHVSGIPPKLWRQFQARAKEIMPDKGDRAWASFLCEAIVSVCSGKSHTFILTDIPNEAKEAFQDTCEQAKLREDQVIAALYRSAHQERLHICRIKPEGTNEDQTHMMVLTGVPDFAWDSWTKFAKELDTPVEEFMAHLIFGAAHGNIRINKEQQEARKEAKAKNTPVEEVQAPYTQEQIERAFAAFMAQQKPKDVTN